MHYLFHITLHNSFSNITIGGWSATAYNDNISEMAVSYNGGLMINTGQFEFTWKSQYRKALFAKINIPWGYVDPTGEDIWQINTVGEVVAHEVTDEFDRFDFVDDDGNTIVNDEGVEQSITMEYGTVIRYSKREYEAYKNNEAGTADIFEIRGDDISEKVYEMFATNVTGTTKNEVSLIKTGYEGDRGHNFISSGHQRGSEPGLSRFIILN